MGKSSFFLLAITLTIVGTAVATGHLAWGTFTGVAILLLGGGIAAGALTIRSRPEDDFVKQKVASQKISNSLVTLSSAAILAVYAAGYHRTGSAAYKFEVQEARRRTAARIAAGLQVPTTPIPRVEAIPTFPPPLSPPLTKDKPRPSSTTVRKTAPAPAPRTAPPTTDPVANTAAASQATQQIQYKDGTYLGWGYSRHGNIQASVVIQGGKIASTAIAQCLTRYSCSWIADLPEQAVTRQSENVDFVSGATESSEAFSDAVAAALSKASE